MSRIKGTVTGEGKSQYSYYVRLDGNQFYYNTKYEPKSGIGDVVGIEFEPKGESRGNIKKLTVLEKNSDGYKGSEGGSWTEKPTSGARSAPAGGDRQDSIVWQHSQEMALRLSTLILAWGGYAVKGKTDEKRLQVEGLVDELTARLFRDALDPRKSAAFTSAAEIDEDAEGGETWGKGEDKPDGSGDGTWDKWDD